MAGVVEILGFQAPERVQLVARDLRNALDLLLLVEGELGILDDFRCGRASASGEEEQEQQKVIFQMGYPLP